MLFAYETLLKSDCDVVELSNEKMSSEYLEWRYQPNFHLIKYEGGQVGNEIGMLYWAKAGSFAGVMSQDDEFFVTVQNALKKAQPLQVVCTIKELVP